MSQPDPQRREILEALGIDCYLPRIQLPGAPQSALYPPAMGETRPGSPEPPPVAPAEPAPEPVAARPPRPPRTQPQAPARAAETSPAATPEKVSAPARAPREEVKLQLQCIRAGGDLAVLLAMPHLGPPQLSARHQALLSNLLRACGLPPGDLAMEDKAFRWPMVTGLHVDNSKRAAATAIKAYLHQKKIDWDVTRLLVLGEAVVARLFEQDADSEQPAVSLSSDWQIAWTRSLDELLQRPVLKKDVWRQVREQFA